MVKFIPTLAQLRCFESAARNESFTVAADELCLTPSAVSHQIRSLETNLNVDLFIRLGQKMFLSASGQQFLEYVRPAFELLETGMEQLHVISTRETLAISVAPSFAEAWLVQNMAQFTRSNPEIEIRLLTAGSSKN